MIFFFSMLKMFGYNEYQSQRGDLQIEKPVSGPSVLDLVQYFIHKKLKVKFKKWIKTLLEGS